MEKPPTLQMCEDYVRAKNLIVDPYIFFNYYEANEWHYKDDKPVKRWKGAMWSWHSRELKRGSPHPCSRSSCKKPGVYISGSDRDGHPYYYCIDHKPKVKPALPETLTKNVLKKVPSTRKNINAQRNAAKDQLDILAGKAARK